MSRLPRSIALFLLAAACSLAAEAQTTIRFGNGPGITTGDPDNEPFNYTYTTVYQESGFTLTTSSVFRPDLPPSERLRSAWDFSDWAHHFGTVDQPGTLFLAASDGSLFRLRGFDAAVGCALGETSVLPFPTFIVSGRLGGSDVFSFRAKANCPAVGLIGPFSTNANPFGDVAIDELVFGAGVLEHDYADNIVLTAVPEPGVWALLLAGLGLAGALRPRRT